MKDANNLVEQIERLEDQLQVMKWVIKRPRPLPRQGHPPTPSVVDQTAGLLRGRLPQGVVYQRRLRREWDARLHRRAR